MIIERKIIEESEEGTGKVLSAQVQARFFIDRENDYHANWPFSIEVEREESESITDFRARVDEELENHVIENDLKAKILEKKAKKKKVREKIRPDIPGEDRYPPQREIVDYDNKVKEKEKV